MRMARGIGTLVVQNTALVSLALEKPPDQETIKALNDVYNVGRHRTVEQEPAFGIRQLVDMALKAFSPSINESKSFGGQASPTPAMLVNVSRLITAYYSNMPDAAIPAQSAALETSFNEWHVLAITQAICDYRKRQGIDGPLFLGIDTHVLSEPACASALEVLAANGVDVMIADKDEYTPTPVISHAILVQYDEQLTSPEQLKAVVKSAGYGVDVSTRQRRLLRLIRIGNDKMRN